MSDQTEYATTWKEFRDATGEMRRERHELNRQINTQALTDAGIAFEERNEGQTLIIRIDGKPRVDFYPSTGRWRVVGDTQKPVMHGGARSFIPWFERQVAD